MKTINIKRTLLLAVGLLALGACRHKDMTGVLANADDNGGYASDNAKMAQSSTDVISIADVAATTPSASGYLKTTKTTLGGCVSITNDSVSVPHVLTIDFGPVDCTGLDGKNRRGAIIVTYMGRYKDVGSTHTITYNNYFVNDNQLSGSKTVTNAGANSTGQIFYNITENDSLSLGTGNGYIVRMDNITRTWLSGYNTPDRMDDAYLLSGSGTLTRANGHQFSMNITTPLEVALSCNWIEAGVVSITGPGGGIRTLDYGSGNCDAEAQLTMNGHSYNITLK